MIVLLIMCRIDLTIASDALIDVLDLFTSKFDDRLIEMCFFLKRSLINASTWINTIYTNQIAACLISNYWILAVSVCSTSLPNDWLCVLVLMTPCRRPSIVSAETNLPLVAAVCLSCAATSLR